MFHDRGQPADCLEGLQDFPHFPDLREYFLDL